MNDSKKDSVSLGMEILEGLTSYSEIHRRRARQLLLTAYSKSTAAKGVLDYLAFAEKHFKISSVQHLVKSSNVDYYEAVKFLKHLDANKFGQFIVGRKGQDSRIAWNFHPKSIGEVAIGKAHFLINVPKKLDDYDGGADIRTSETHSFLLRPDFKLTIDLPIDFDRSDEQRLTKWLGTIPFD